MKSNLRNITLALVASAVLPSAVSAQNVQKCISIKNDADRLRCYDLVAGYTALDSSTKGAWQTSKKNNPIDDSTTATAALEASEGKSRFGKKPYLVARCKSNKTELFVIWHEYLGDDDTSVYSTKKRVTYRFDKEKAQSELWSTSTDHKATFANRAIQFLRKLAAASELVMQTTPHSESPMTLRFQLAGANSAIASVAETCQWKLTEKDEKKSKSQSIAAQNAKNGPVLEAQKLLNKIGYDVGVPDGIMGPRTKNALSAFAKANDLDAAIKVKIAAGDNEAITSILPQLRAKAGGRAN